MNTTTRNKDRKPMKEYRVLISYTEGGRLDIMATSKADAEKKAFELMEDKGGEMLKDIDTLDRDYFVIDSEEL
jgi:uncharacterized protein with GYD domain